MKCKHENIQGPSLIKKDLFRFYCISCGLLAIVRKDKLKAFIKTIGTTV